MGEKRTYPSLRDLLIGLSAPGDGIHFFESQCARLRDELRSALEAADALEPFAKITPSSFYPEDGSEAEHYRVVLCDGSQAHDFTGADLARARAARVKAA